MKPVMKFNISPRDQEPEELKNYEQIRILLDGIQYDIYPDYEGKLEIRSTDTERKGRMLLSVQPHSGNVILLKAV